MVRYKNLAVVCGCGYLFLQYKKGGRGRLRKIHQDRVIEDKSGLMPKLKKAPVGTNIFCEQCGKRIGTMQIIKGKYVLKVNQGVIRC